MKTTDRSCAALPQGEDISQQEKDQKADKFSTSVSFPADAILLMEKYQPLVYAIASRFRGVEYDDLVQEGMVGLWNAAKRYNPSQGSSFGAFASLCIQRRMLAVAASHRKRLDISFSQLETDDGEVFGENCLAQEDSALSPENLLILKEELAAVQRRIDESLSRRERQILQLYLEGLTYQEIAERLSITVKSVDNGIQRLRKKLKGS